MDNAPVQPAHPPPPWRLCGRAFLNIQLVRVERIRKTIPPEFKVVSLLPGRTIGGIYLAEYGPESTLEYSELIVFSAIVRFGGRMGAWVSNIYVDSHQSLAGGRAIWGLPKQIADFYWGEEADVQCDGREVLKARNLHAGSGIPLKMPLPAFGLDSDTGRPLHFTGRCRGRVWRRPARFEIPSDSPFASLGLGRGWSFRITDLDATIPAPDESSPRG